MRYRVVYTETVVTEVVFDGPDNLTEDDFFEGMDADPHRRILRLDVVERTVDGFFPPVRKPLGVPEYGYCDKCKRHGPKPLRCCL